MTAPIRYCITPGVPGAEALGDLLLQLGALAASRRIDRIQIREKYLPPRALYDFTVRVLELARPHGVRVLVNDRADVALAAGADGVHLPARSLPPHLLRKAGIRFLGVSCHDARELRRAQDEGADFAVLGPVFSPLSKSISEPPLGLEEFQRLAQSVRIPVLALGGVTVENTASCLAAGAAGIAGITLFSASARRPSIETAGYQAPR